MKIRITNDQNVMNQKMLVLILFSDMLYALAIAVFLLAGWSTGILYYLYYIIFGVTFVVMAIRSGLSNPNRAVRRLLLALLAIWIISELYWILSNQEEIYKQSVTCIILTIITCIPVFIFTINSTDYNIAIEISKYYSIITVIYAICYSIGTAKGLYSSTDYMSFSYNLMPGCIFALYRGICQKKKISLIIGIVLMLFLISMGSRGVLIAVFVSAIILVFTSRDKITAKTIIIWAIVIVAILLIVFNINSIMLFVLRQFPGSRTVSMFTNDFLNGRLSLANRNLYYEYFSNHSSDYIPWGTGILKDRYLISREVSRITYGESWLGCYIHNFYLEIIMQFGFIFGGLILVLFTYKFIASFFNLKYLEPSKKYMFLMFVPATFITYMVSGSYLHSMRFYFMLALVVVASTKAIYQSKGSVAY